MTLGDTPVAMMTLQHTHIVGEDPRGLRMLCENFIAHLLKAVSEDTSLSRFNLSRKARIFFGILGILAGTYACPSSALAEVEEDTNQAVNKPVNNLSATSNHIITNLLIEDYANEEMARYLSKLDSSHDHAEFVDVSAEKLPRSPRPFSTSTNSYEFDNALIPETVWSLNASTGAHLDQISGGPGSDIYVVFGGSAEINDFWIRMNFGLWANNKVSMASVLLGTSPKFQAASCGGSAAERGDLDYCDKAKLAASQPSDLSSKPEQNDSDGANQTASNNVFASDDGPAFDGIARSQIGPITSDLQATLSILGPCDVSASCASILIELLGPPSLDLPYTAPPALNPIYVDPGSGSHLLPVFPPKPLKPIPEASTWVMTVIGFSIMAFVFGRKRRPRIQSNLNYRRLESLKILL